MGCAAPSPPLCALSFPCPSPWLERLKLADWVRRPLRALSPEPGDAAACRAMRSAATSVRTAARALRKAVMGRKVSVASPGAPADEEWGVGWPVVPAARRGEAFSDGPSALASGTLDTTERRSGGRCGALVVRGSGDDGMSASGAGVLDDACGSLAVSESSDEDEALRAGGGSALELLRAAGSSIHTFMLMKL